MHPRRVAPGRHSDDRAIFALALPALGALAADPLYSLADTAFVGNLGVPQLGALAIGTAAFTASFWLFSFLAYGVTPRVARAVGAGDPVLAATIGVQALLLAMAIGLSVTVFGVVLAGPIVRLLGASGAVEGYAEAYLRIRVLSSIPVLVALVGHGWLRGAQDTRTPMFVAVAGAATNIALDYLLIYPFGWGIEGAAWATVVAQSATAGAFLWILAARMDGPKWRPHVGVATSLLIVGVDLAVRTGALIAALTLATSVAARMGDVPLASWQIAIQVFLLLSFTLDSLAIAAQALVGRHLGEEDAARAADISRRLIVLGVLFGAGLGAVLVVLHRPLAGIFTDSREVTLLAGGLLIWLGAIQPLSAAAFTLDGILIGASDTRFLAVAMVAASTLFAILQLTALSQEWGVAGLAIAATIWLGVRAATTGVRFARGRWAWQP